MHVMSLKHALAMFWLYRSGGNIIFESILDELRFYRMQPVPVLALPGHTTPSTRWVRR